MERRKDFFVNNRNRIGSRSTCLLHLIYISFIDKGEYKGMEVM